MDSDRESSKEAEVQQPEYDDSQIEIEGVDEIIEYVCDVCKTSKFPTFEEAFHHENSCTGNSTNPISQVEKNDHREDDDDDVIVLDKGNSSPVNRTSLSTTPSQTIDPSKELPSSHLQKPTKRLTAKFATKSCLSLFSESADKEDNSESDNPLGANDDDVDQANNSIKASSHSSASNRNSSKSQKFQPALKVETRTPSPTKNDTKETPNTSSVKKLTFRKKEELSVVSPPLERHTFVGQRVYAEFPDNQQWYWGIISKQYQPASSTFNNTTQQQIYSSASSGINHRNTSTGSYQVWFDDGDVVDGISGIKIVTEQEYILKWKNVYGGREPPTRPAHLSQYSLDDQGNIIVPTRTKELSASKTAPPRRKSINAVVNNVLVNKDDGAPLCNDKGEAIIDMVDDNDEDCQRIVNMDNDDGRQDYLIAAPDAVTTNPKTLEELFQAQCQKCYMCTRPECNQCASCLWNASHRRYSNFQQRVCFRKVCLRIPEEQKAQPLQRFPKGWRFYFKSNYAATSPTATVRPQLVLLSPKNIRFRSLERAMKRYWKALTRVPNLARNFYEHVGYCKDDNDSGDMHRHHSSIDENTRSPWAISSLDDGDGTITSKPVPARRKRVSFKQSKLQQQQQQEQQGDGLCPPGPSQADETMRTLSSAKDIGSRVYCKFENNFYYWGEIVRKKVDLSGKMLYSVQFDDGDTLDDISDTGGDELEGNIYTEMEFFNHVGVYPPQPRSKISNAKRRKVEQGTEVPSPVESPAENPSNRASSMPGSITQVARMELPTVIHPVRKFASAVVPKSTPGAGKPCLDMTSRSSPDIVRTRACTPAELFQKRCQSCSSCTKKDCMRCTSCINNRDGLAETTECCLRKMCRRISKDLKRQPAPGLPKGWTFVSGTGPKIVLISPGGDEFTSIRRALDRCKGQIKDIDAAMIDYEDHVGGSVLWNDDKHVLVGKEYCHVWTDVNGHNKIIYGQITACERDKLDEDYTSFTVTYNQESLQDVIRTMSVCGSYIEPCADLTLEWALGGHLVFISRLSTPPQVDEHIVSIPSRKWLTPDMRTEELVVGPDEKKLPRLILVWNAFRLVFTVKQSSIPDSGLGVFVECTSLIPDRSAFCLQKCEMLDLGVYAPFRKEDLKEECIFLVKNFILGLKCEEWAFDAGETSTPNQYDITDDWTGDLHSIAAQHIPAYVNECQIEAHPTIHAEFDPEGVVHYLLGTEKTNFILPTDGSMIELFSNYGPGYERVRIRKNYSFLPVNQQAVHAKSVLQENLEYLEEIAGFQELEVTSSMEFLTHVIENGTLPAEFVMNACCMAFVLHLRGKTLVEENRNDSPLNREFSQVVSNFQTVVRSVLERSHDMSLSALEASGQQVELLSVLLKAVLEGCEASEIQRIVGFFCLPVR